MPLRAGIVGAQSVFLSASATAVFEQKGLEAGRVAAWRRRLLRGAVIRRGTGVWIATRRRGQIAGFRLRIDDCGGRSRFGFVAVAALVGLRRLWRHDRDGARRGARDAALNRQTRDVHHLWCWLCRWRCFGLVRRARAGSEQCGAARRRCELQRVVVCSQRAHQECARAGSRNTQQNRQSHREPTRLLACKERGTRGRQCHRRHRSDRARSGPR